MKKKLLALLLAGVFLFSACARADSSPVSEDSSAASEETLEATLQSATYVGTILPLSEDAGMEYVEETLFLGDSNTQRMLYYHDITGASLQNSIGVESMGIHSFTTSKCAQFEGDSKSYTMAEAAAKLKPRRVVITFGTNNVGMNVDTFIEHYREAIEAIEENWPYADIIIGSIFPVDQYRKNTSITMARIDSMNAALISLARQTGCKFLNWSEALLDEAIEHCTFEYTLQDGVHLTRAGMEAIFEYYRTHSYITEDSRPSPLGSVAARRGIMPGLVTSDPHKVSGPINWDASSSSASTASSESEVSSSLPQDSSFVESSSVVESSSAELPSPQQPDTSSSVPAETPSSVPVESSGSAEITVPESTPDATPQPPAGGEEAAGPAGEDAATEEQAEPTGE